METKTEFLSMVPVLPSSHISTDISWYKEKARFQINFHDDRYASISRDNIFIHLQWHADTNEDPLLGGSVVRIFVKNIKLLFDDFVKMGTVEPDKLRLSTPWNTNEFGFFDLNNNAFFFVEDIY